jgi:F-type H+-transporting ATPase subunit b
LHNLRIQRNRIRSHIHRIDPIGRSADEHSRLSCVRSSSWAGPISWAAIATTLVLLASPALASDLELIPVKTVLPIMLIGFVALIFPLNSLLFQPIFRALDARAERIAGARERSEQLQRNADEVLTRYETSIQEARSESEAARQSKLETARAEQVQLTSTARGEAERELESARGEMNQSIEDARTNLRASAEGLAQAAAERVLGRSLT